MIKAATIRLLHNPQPSEVAALLLRAKADGANTVSVVVSHYTCMQQGTSYASFPPLEYDTASLIWSDVGQDSRHPYINTPNIALTELVCHMAERMGLQVMIKPHLDSYDAAWRYWIQWDHVASRFQAAYRAFLKPYLDIARHLHNSPILCLGCELGDVSLSTNRYLGAEFWIRQAKWARTSGYSGALTYAANWGQEADALAPLWATPEITHIGIDAYYPLQWGDNPPPSPAYEDILAAWDEPSGPEWWYPVASKQPLTLAHNAADKPFLFTEIGYSNYTEALRNPGADAPQGAVRDDRLQADAIRAARERWDSEPLCAGYVWWEMAANAPEISHSIVDRPAEAVAFA